MSSEQNYLFFVSQSYVQILITPVHMYRAIILLSSLFFVIAGHNFVKSSLCVNLLLLGGMREKSKSVQ